MAVSAPRNRAAQTAHLKRTFLEAFRQAGNVALACRLSKTPRRNVYEWREHDSEFAAAFEDAEREAVETLEAEAIRRAVEGVERRKGIYYLGDQIGEQVEREYSDTLLIFLLKARDPKKYAKNQLELSGEVKTGVIFLPERKRIER